MNTNADPTPIATPEQFKSALLKVRDRLKSMETPLAMLRAQFRSPNQTITATKLAAEVGFKEYSGANLQYGSLARAVAEVLGYTPDKRPDGTTRWWRALAYTHANAAESEDGHFQWIMRPELATALQEMRWV